MQWLCDLIDRRAERAVRHVAHNHGRRSLLGRLGVALVGGAVLEPRGQPDVVPGFEGRGQ